MFVTVGQQVISSPLVLTSNLSINPPAGTTLTISGGIDEASPGMSLSLDGPGTLVLGGTNTYSGGTAVHSGTLVVTSGSALPSGTALTVGAGGVLIFDPSAGAGSRERQSAAAESVSVTPTAASLPACHNGRDAPFYLPTFGQCPRRDYG